MKDLEALYETMRKNMKRVREEAGVSKRELAKEIGMDRAFFNVSMDKLLKY